MSYLLQTFTEPCHHWHIYYSGVAPDYPAQECSMRLTILRCDQSRYVPLNQTDIFTFRYDALLWPTLSDDVHHPFLFATVQPRCIVLSCTRIPINAKRTADQRLWTQLPVSYCAQTCEVDSTARNKAILCRQSTATLIEHCMNRRKRRFRGLRLGLPVCGSV